MLNRAAADRLLPDELLLVEQARARNQCAWQCRATTNRPEVGLLRVLGPLIIRSASRRGLYII